jgi:L-seryl-tRNA(Ser) seleniumtransferase
VDLRTRGVDEPLVRDSLAAGVNIVSFSCDKLLGGPQSGIIAGDAELVTRIRRNPMYRAFRADKLIIEVLQTTLRHFAREDWKAIPTLRMIFAEADEIRQRAERVVRRIEGVEARVRKGESAIGGGSTPDQTLPSWVIELNVASAARFESKLRSAPIPVIARIEREKIILDMRTVSDEEENALITAIHTAR